MKSFLSFALVLFLSLTILAQPYKKGDKIAQVGIGYGHAGIYGDMDFPPISLGFQYGIEDKISIGGIVGFSSSSDDYGWGKWSYSYIFIGARGEYHFLENSENIDAYGGLTLGYDIVSSSWEAKDEGNHFGNDASSSYALWGLHVGAKYYFNPKVAAFAELGYGVSYITAGVAFKL
jgi:hypothetical protein